MTLTKQHVGDLVHTTPIVFLNGQFVSQENAVVSVLDRSFLYGDGLFETLRVHSGKAIRWDQHIERLGQGAEYLKLRLPYSSAQMQEFAGELIQRNQMADAILRLTLSRGVGVRGYSTKGADRPVLVMTLHPAPALTSEFVPRWTLVTSSVRIPAGEPLARFKTCNKLPHIMARLEAESAGADEALVLDSAGNVVEGASSNVFWIDRAAVCTPPLACGILPGVTRAVVLEICSELGLAARDQLITPALLPGRDGVFLSMSSLGIVEVATVDGKSLKLSPMIEKIGNAYRGLMKAECAA